MEDFDPRNRGVEYWMKDRKEMMIVSVRYVLLKSIEDYTTMPRTE